MKRVREHSLEKYIEYALLGFIGDPDHLLLIDPNDRRIDYVKEIEDTFEPVIERIAKVRKLSIDRSGNYFDYIKDLFKLEDDMISSALLECFKTLETRLEKLHEIRIGLEKQFQEVHDTQVQNIIKKIF
jgi:hypothetical protein